MRVNRTLLLLSILFMVVGFIGASYFTKVITFAQEGHDYGEQISYESNRLEEDRRYLSYSREHYKRKEINLTPYVQGFLLLGCVGAGGIIAWAYQTKIQTEEPPKK